MRNLLRFTRFTQKMYESTQPEIKEGGKGDPYKYKRDEQDFYFAKKGTELWKKAVKPEGIDAIKKMFTDTPVESKKPETPEESKKPETPKPDQNDKKEVQTILKKKQLTRAGKPLSITIYKDGSFAYQMNKTNDGKLIYSPSIRLSYQNLKIPIKIIDIFPRKITGKKIVGSIELEQEDIPIDFGKILDKLTSFIMSKPGWGKTTEVATVRVKSMLDMSQYAGISGMPKEYTGRTTDGRPIMVPEEGDVSIYGTII